MAFVIPLRYLSTIVAKVGGGENSEPIKGLIENQRIMKYWKLHELHKNAVNIAYKQIAKF